MKLIVGLGNPGTIYAHSRHNVGYNVVRALSRHYRVALKKEGRFQAQSAKVKIGGEDLILAFPLTFMNLSGAAVKGLLGKYKLDLNGLLVVCDDLDLEFGRLKLRPSGSSGGHRGLKSIIDSLGSQDFSRLRIGIGRPARIISPSEYVLTNFTKQEQGELGGILERAVECCLLWLDEGTQKAMNVFNKNVLLRPSMGKLW